LNSGEKRRKKEEEEEKKRTATSNTVMPSLAITRERAEEERFQGPFKAAFL